LQKRPAPFPIAVGVGTLHCGGACALADICAEWLVFMVPAITLTFGWRTVFSHEIFATWIIDFLFAYVFGIMFQYFTIAPMRKLSVKDGIVAAIKADTISPTMFGR
jgi:Domain of unknown function (DUF4396)